MAPHSAKRKLLFEHCDASLKRLRMDYVDCYMLHWPLNPVSLKHFTSDPALLADPPTAEETFSGLEELKKQGKIRSIGVSNFGRKQLEEALKTGVQIDVNEITYNLLSRAIEKDILPFCIENGISVVGSMALQQGLLAGIYKTPESVPAAQAHSRHFSAARGGNQSAHTGPGAEKEVFDAISAIQKIAQEQQLHIAQLAIAWVLEKQGVAATLVGSRNLSELESNIRAAGVTLSADVVSELDRVSRPVLEALGYNADYYEDEQNSRIF